MKFIGITGGVGAGKTELLKYFSKRLDTKVMLADDIAKNLCNPGTACNQKLQELFLEDKVFDEAGNMDRAAVAAVAFREPAKLEAMNQLIHPAVRQYVLEVVQEEQRKGTLKYLILEAALLIEEHYDEICDELWYIYTSKENRRQRLRQSRGYSDEKIEQIFANQLTEEEYRRHCVREIDNNGTTEETIAQVQRIINSEGDDTNGEYE